jgi:glutathione synthase/RimK-type ligase-like ATP-grasp enzyme
MKVQLRCTKSGLKSGSLKRIAEALSTVLGYKVFRTTEKRANRKQFVYGDLVDKLAQYKWFKEKGLSALEFTTSADEADAWVSKGHAVFGRKLLNASCGDGIVVIESGSKSTVENTHCPVYTKYKPKKREFRVHVFKDKVVTIVEKRRKTDWKGDKSDTKIRNLANGYIFCQEVDLSEKLRARINSLAVESSKVCSSDFRGVDLGYNEKHDDLFVIEVNSAPGIEGSNVGKYIEVMKGFVK